MTGMLDKRSTDDYIPMSSNMMIPLHNSGAQLLKPVVRSEEEKEHELHIPLTPSPDLLDHSEDVFSKLSPDDSACGALSYTTPFPVFSYPSYHHSTSPQDLPAGYFTPPFPTPSPVSTPQSFVFDPTFPQLPYTSQPGNMMGSLGGDFASRHLPALPLLKPPPAKRMRTKKKSTTSSSNGSGASKTQSSKTQNSGSASKAQNSGSSSSKPQRSAVVRKVNELQTTLLEYHDAASEELWRPGGEPRKKTKSCQTTFKQPLQLASYEEFASLALLLSVFHKEASEDAGRRYGVKCKG